MNDNKVKLLMLFKKNKNKEIIRIIIKNICKIECYIF